MLKVSKIFSIILLTLILIACGNENESNGEEITPPTNQLPDVYAGSDNSLEENIIAKLVGSATDNDGTIVSYQWLQIAGTPVSLDSPDNINTTFNTPEVTVDEVFTFELTATDNDGGEASDTVVITILNVNQAPVVEAGENQTVKSNDLVTLTGNASDQDGEVVTTVWKQTVGTAVILRTPNQISTEFTVDHFTENEVLKFSFSATDSLGAQSTEYVEVFVSVTDITPTVSAGEEQLIFNGSTVSLIGTASANNGGTIASYQWEQVSGTQVVLDAPNAEVTTFEIPEGLTDEVLIFEFKATDNAGNTADSITNVVISSQALLADVGIPDNMFDSCIVYNIDGSDFGLEYVHEARSLICFYDEYEGYSSQLSSLDGLSKLFNLRNLGLHYQGNLTKEEFGQMIALNALESLTITESTFQDFTTISNKVALNQLSLLDTSINNLEGLGKLKNLTQISISNGDIDQIPNIQNLKSLESLAIVNNNLTDISAVGALSNLGSLDLKGNAIVNYSALNNLKQLTYLNLSDNELSGSFTVNELPKLQSLWIDNNDLSEITNITERFPELWSFRSVGNPLTDISGLSNNTVLNQIQIEESLLTELPAIENLPELNSINLSNNELLNSVGQLENLPELERIHIHTSNIDTFLDLSGLEALKSLAITSSKIHEISDLSGHASLANLVLSNNLIESIEAGNLPTALTYLSLSNNKLTTLPVLSGFDSLSSLNLDNNEISTITLGSHLPELYSLDLENNGITSLDWVSDYNPTSVINLSSNGVSTVTELIDLTTSNFYLRNTQISCEDIAKLQETKWVWSDCQ
ncbi:leucine-rich repeat domain-containing protein [Shewanella donghaensis]|uniref:leucine-rich repeat domain-containing protein n=1 Tax=Shewanella donghaensis TaxID=238836 RepID=UPI001183A486|nr:leucine-rich repeat domain-containing protein [Shewanella donghaensis]